MTDKRLTWSERPITASERAADVARQAVTVPFLDEGWSTPSRGEAGPYRVIGEPEVL